MIIYPVKIYKPNDFGELEYVETIYPDELVKSHWHRFEQETGQLNLHSSHNYTRTGASDDNAQTK